MQLLFSGFGVTEMRLLKIDANIDILRPQKPNLVR